MKATSQSTYMSVSEATSYQRR